MTVMNQLDRFNLAMDVIDRVPRLQATSGAAREELKNKLIEHKIYVQSHGEDMPEIRNWSWEPAPGPTVDDERTRARHPRRAESMRVLVVNAGSSSLKLAVIEDGRRSRPHHRRALGGRGPPRTDRRASSTQDRAGRSHRASHRPRRSRLTEPVLVDDDVLDYLDSIEDLAPLHNPEPSPASGRHASCCAGSPEVACFDTTFHAYCRPRRARTRCPRVEQRWSLRRYGFHGLSHAYAVRRGAELIAGHPSNRARGLVPPGRGASLAAVVGGPLGRHDDGLHTDRGPGDGDPAGFGRPGPAAVAAGTR